MRSILFLFLAAFSLSSSADMRVLSLDEVAVAQANEDGTYTVVCTNGNREIVSSNDFYRNNVCPNRAGSEPSEILSLQKRDDGNFNVVCKDLTKTVATTEEILTGKICNPGKPPVTVVEDGNYIADANWRPCRVEATVADGVLKQIKLFFNPEYILATCVGNICKGAWSTDGKYTYTITILDNKSFKAVFDQANNTTTIYRKQ